MVPLPETITLRRVGWCGGRVGSLQRGAPWHCCLRSRPGRYHPRRVTTGRPSLKAFNTPAYGRALTDQSAACARASPAMTAAFKRGLYPTLRVPSEKFLRSECFQGGAPWHFCLRARAGRCRPRRVRGTSLIRNSAPLGPCIRTTPRALRLSLGEGGRFF